MIPPIRKITDAISESLWFVPAVWVLACGAAAFGAVALDSYVARDLAVEVPLVFGGGPEGARGLLSAIASSTITVVGVVFSITMVALQLASAQYSPRVLRNFMRDRPSQVTLGSFIGAFVYALLVLRTVRADSGDREEFVPVLAVTGAVLLAVVAVAMLVYFVHHIASRMQVSHITATVAKETLDEIDRQAKAHEPADDGASEPRPEAPGSIIPAQASGYLQYVEIDELVELAESEGAVIGLEVAPGEWVQRHAPLFRAWGGSRSDDLTSRLHDHVSVGDERVVYQDPGFGVQQLVDIGVKALSPGINDPTTARNVLHRLAQILVAAGRAQLTPAHHRDESGTVRLLVPAPGFESLLWTAVEEIHHFGREIPTIARAIRAALDTVEKQVSVENRPAVARVRRALDMGRSAGVAGEEGFEPSIS